MTVAWYGHLKLQEMKISSGWPLILVILFSWGIAFFEYCAQVPANRIGFADNGGPFNLIQLKVIQEVISLTVFTVIVTLLFKNQALQQSIVNNDSFRFIISCRLISYNDAKIRRKSCRIIGVKLK